MNYRTPGVYVEEISTLPASVAGVETAIPAFVGYTQFTESEGESVLFEPVRITSLLEYREMFGGPQPETFIFSINDTYDEESRLISREVRSEEHTSELQSRGHLVCRLLLEERKKHI